MSTIFSSSTNLTLFRVDGTIPGSQELFPVFAGALARLAFKDIFETLDEQSTGWVQPDDYTATGFSDPTHIWIDRYVFLSVRKDTRRVPGAVLKQEISAMESKWLESHPQLKRPPKQVREDIKDTARLSLLAKTLPVPKVLHAVWDTQRGLMYVLSASQSEVELFCELFGRTFEGFGLLRLAPFDIAAGAVSSSLPLCKKLAAANQSTSGFLLDLINSNVWIGRGFANAILEQEIAVPGVSVYVGNKICLSGDGKKAVFSGAIDENLVGVRAAISEGRQISDITVCLENNDGQLWQFQLNTETFQMKGIKCPPAVIDPSGDDATEVQATMLLRIGSIQSLLEQLIGMCLREYLGEVLK